MGRKDWRGARKPENKFRAAQRTMERKTIGVTLRYGAIVVWIRELRGVADFIVEYKRNMSRVGHITGVHVSYPVGAKPR